MNIAFDTNCISIASRGSVAQPEHYESLCRILALKRSGTNDWAFYYLDGVRRELLGPDLSQRQYEDEEILSCFDRRVSLFILPVVLPAIIQTPQQNEINRKFIDLAQAKAVSKKDGIILAHTVNAGCAVLITADGPLLRNQGIKNLCLRDHSLVVLSPLEFESGYCND